MYGHQLSNLGSKSAKLYPKGEVDPIPSWIMDAVVRPIVQIGVIPKDFVNSVVITEYLPGGCLTSHIEPSHLFDR